MADNIVFQQKPAFNVSMQGDLSILPFRLALTGTRIAPPGSAEDVRYAALRAARLQTPLVDVDRFHEFMRRRAGNGQDRFTVTSHSCRTYSGAIPSDGASPRPTAGWLQASVLTRL